MKHNLKLSSISKIMIPEITVLMSVYNEPIAWVCQAIDSILNQTFRDFEYIIINDNPSSNEYKELLHRYAAKDLRIILIENKENKGLTKSLNIGLEIAKGRYVARMDADDISMPNRFEVQYDFMESHPEVDVCGTWAYMFGNVERFSSKHLIVPEAHNQIKIRAFFYSPMIHPTVMIRMERLPKRLYNEDFKKAQDYVLWGSLINQGFRLHNIPNYLIKYRITTKSGKKTYRNLQFVSANYVRENLLKQLLPTIDFKTIELHNKICNEQECNLVDAEKWLKRLNDLLLDEENLDKDSVESLISRLWININLTNDSSLSNYRKSSLSRKLSLNDTLRFIKRKLFKNKIIRSIIWGGESLIYILSYLLYYCIAQYLPSNYSKVGFVYKYVRYQLGRHIFAHCGKNVDVNRKANFGNGRHISIGDNSGIGANCRIPNNITIGANVMMAPNCTILANVNHSFGRTDIPMREQGVTHTAPTVIGNDVWIGQNVLITPGRTIKDGTIIAAGTVLTKDFPEYSIVGGNPSRLIRSRVKN